MRRLSALSLGINLMQLKVHQFNKISQMEIITEEQNANASNQYLEDGAKCKNKNQNNYELQGTFNNYRT